METSMTKIDLLRPRFKVIADYPSSHFKVGSIKQCAEKESGDVNFYKQYPHLFQELFWWQERKVEDMPEYVKVTRRNGHLPEGAIYKVEEWRIIKGNFWACNPRHYIHADNHEPSTESEYTQYINNKEQL